MNIRKYIQPQTGGVHVIVLMLIVGAVFISLIFMDMFTVYISKHISQKGADAAALAASIEMNEVYEDALRQEVNVKLNELAQIIEQEVQQEINRLLAEAATEEDEEGEPIEIDPEEIREQIMNEWERTHPLSINRLRYGPAYHVDAIQLLKEFYNDARIVSLMCSSIRAELATIREIASYYAAENDADELVDFEFPYNSNFEVFIRVKRETSFMTVPDQAFAAGQNDMYAEAAADILFPRGLTFQARHCR